MIDKRPRIFWRSWLLVTFIAWAGVVMATMASAKNHASSSETALREVAELSDLDRLSEADFELVLRDVEGARGELSEAAGHLESAVMLPTRVIPFVGTQIESADSLVTAGISIIDALVPAIETVSHAIDRSGDLTEGQLMAELSDELASANGVLASLDLGPSGGLAPPLADARNDMAVQITDLLGPLSDAEAIARGMASFLDDSTYLVLVANNAEMRLGGGMPLSVGEMRIAGSDVQVPELQRGFDMFPVPETPVTDIDIANRWGFLSPTNDFRKLGYSARFSEWVGPQAIEMWSTQSDAKIDGVIQIDPLILRALLEVVGPVQAGDLSVDAENVLDYLLVGQYVLYGDKTDTVQEARYEQQALITAAIIAGFEEANVDPISLMKALRPLVSGRHILAYAVDEIEQESWLRLGVSGTLVGDEVGVYLLNLTASKQDPFVDLTVDVSRETVDGNVHVQLDILVENRTPYDTSPYAIGAWEKLEIGRGDYIARLAVYAPALAENVTFATPYPLEVFGPDGQVWVIVTRVQVERKGQLRTSVSFVLPEDHGPLKVLSSARYPSSVWNVGDETYRDDSPIVIPLGE